MTTLRAPAAFAQFQAKSGTVYIAGSDALILNVATGDVGSLLNSGCSFTNAQVRNYYVPAPLAANATVIVGNVAATNIALTIAAQPDVPRPLQTIFAPGAAAVTAGSLTLVYTAHDGTTVTDVFSLVTALSVSLTLATSKGCARLTSATIAAIAGGSSPTIQIGTTALLSLVGLSPLYSDLVLFKEILNGVDETPGTVTGPNVSPTTAPNGTRNFSFGFTFNS